MVREAQLVSKSLILLSLVSPSLRKHFVLHLAELLR